MANQDDFRTIDIRDAANIGFVDEVANDKKGGWPDQGKNNDLRNIQSGILSYKGVPFDILSTNFTKTCIALRGKYRPYFPLESPSIKIEEKGELICFLGACAWNASVGEEVLRMIVEYESKSAYCDVAFEYGEHIGGWWNPSSLPLGDVGWRGENYSASIGLYNFVWKNPYPQERIKSVRFISADSDASPMIAAMTLVRKSKVSEMLLCELDKKKIASQSSTLLPAKASISIDFSKSGRTIPATVASLSNGINTNRAYIPQGIVLAAAGNRKAFFRIQTHPAEPAIAPDQYDYSKLDAQLDYIEQMGFIPIISISKGPHWIAKHGRDGKKLKRWIPNDEEVYKQYCLNVIKHFMARKNPVLWYELGNEPDLKGWSSELYVRLFKAVSKEVLSISPHIKLGGPVSCGPNIGWAKLLVQEAGDKVGFLSYHQYGYSTPFDTPDQNIINRLELYESAAKKYKDLLEENNIECPILLTEVNTSWRFPETDPRIRTNFGAAWTTVAIGNFLKGGGDTFCFFTYNGGFGMTRELKEGTMLYPVYHAYWLLRKFFYGKMIYSESDNNVVKSYGYINEHEAGLFVINVSDTSTEVKLSLEDISYSSNRALFYMLNKKTWEDIKCIGNNKQVPLLSPLSKLLQDEKQWSFTLKPYEVRLIRFMPDNVSKGNL